MEYNINNETQIGELYMSKDNEVNENDVIDEEVMPSIITLEDEDGQEHSFELVDTQEIEGSTYTALIPYFESDDDMMESDSELLVLKVAEEDGEEYLNIIENEEEFNRVTTIFVEKLQDLYDIKD